MQSFLFYGIAIAAVCSYALLHVLAKKAQLSVPPFTFMATTMFVLAALAFVASLLYEKPFQMESWKNSDIVLVVAFGAVNFVAFALYLKAISGIPLSHYQLIVAALGPVAAAALAYIFLSEYVSVRFFIAIPIILAGLYLAISN
ncbi:EamA family transporter [Candidatus Kaiserbacteria bacterium]|nr:EamA family transporter [Candidatus Kaiserbacteria bacterium]